MKNTQLKDEIIFDTLDMILSYQSLVNNNELPGNNKQKTVYDNGVTNLDNCIHTHKCEGNKVEVNTILEVNKSGSTIKELYKNIDNLTEASEKDLIGFNYIALYLFAEKKKTSTTKISEGKKKFIKYGKRICFVRCYKLVGPTQAKVEVTSTLKKGESKEKLAKLLGKIIIKCVKGIEGSCKPYYFEGGKEFVPMSKIKESKNIKSTD